MSLSTAAADLSRHVSVSEVARLLGVSEQTVKGQYIAKCGLPAVRLTQTTIRIPLDGLNEWLRERAINEVVNQAPPLSDDQRSRIAGALKGGGSA